MKELNSREKNFGVITVIGCIVIGGWGINSRFDRRLARQAEELAVDLERVEKTKAMLSIPVAVEKETKEVVKATAYMPPKQSSLFILQDLAEKSHINSIKIRSTTKISEHTFSLVAEGEFAEMMRFLSFLERRDGKFAVMNASWGRQTALSDKQAKPNRNILATFVLMMKG